MIMSLGLFYSMSLYGRLKAESRLLERVVSEDPGPFVSGSQDSARRAPENRNWPPSIEDLYDWPVASPL